MDYINREANVLIMLVSTRSCDLLFDVCRCVFSGAAVGGGAAAALKVTTGMAGGAVNTNVDLIRRASHGLG